MPSDDPIVIEAFTHRYERKAPPAVDGLSLRVVRGEILGLLGPNGAGKTTTLHAILGLLRPTSGRVQVFGADPLAHRSRVLQRLNFASVDVDMPSNLTVGECLAIYSRLYGVANRRRRIEELMEQFSLAALRKRIFATLSAGERMRLKLAKALLNDPELLILDEPTLSLDPHMAQRVRDLLRRIQRERGITIVHTSHNMREVETFCDRILFLLRGRRFAEGPPAEVLARFKSASLDELFIRVAEGGDLLTPPADA